MRFPLGGDDLIIGPNVLLLFTYESIQSEHGCSNGL